MASDLKVIRLEQPIQESKYAEIVGELTKRDIGNPVAYSAILATGNISTLTLSPEKYDATTAVLSDLNISYVDLSRIVAMSFCEPRS